MDQALLEQLPKFLETLGLDDEPVGIHFTDILPEKALLPKLLPLPTADREMAKAINWPEIFGNFSCALGRIRLARVKKRPAVFDADHFGCPGCAFWMGFLKPQTETIIHYVSSGVPGVMEGEFYQKSPDVLRKIFNDIDPVPAPARHCVIKPLSLFGPEDEPLLVAFFTRPEALCGLHQLAGYVTGDPLSVASPWSAACGSLVAWPMKFMAQRTPKAVIGGWDPSARKFFGTDELSFTVPFGMFRKMTESYGGSFLSGHTWALVKKKIGKSRRAWSKTGNGQAAGD